MEIILDCPGAITSILVRGGRRIFDTLTHRGDCNVIGVMYSQVRECWQLPDAGKCKKQIVP